MKSKNAALARLENHLYLLSTELMAEESFCDRQMNQPVINIIHKFINMLQHEIMLDNTQIKQEEKINILLKSIENDAITMNTKCNTVVSIKERNAIIDEMATNLMADCKVLRDMAYDSKIKQMILSDKPEVTSCK